MMNESKLLFLATKATRPSYRYRVEQMMPFLEERGFQCHVRFFPKNPIARMWFYRSLPEFDAVFIQKRTLNPLELSLCRKLAKRMIFDMDDSIMFDGRGEYRRRQMSRFDAMISNVDGVICGNQFLYEQAIQSKRRAGRFVPIWILPTAINTERFTPGIEKNNDTKKVTIGWTGSQSTNGYLNAVFPQLAQVEGNVELKIISNTTRGFNFKLLGSMPYRYTNWSAESEVAETAEFDIGLMPLPDDNLTRGKCGCKLLQYMALGIPAVCSGIGVNRDIVQQGRNGFIPETNEQWTSTLTQLAADPALRSRVGAAGRRTAESHYALRKIAVRLATILDDVVKSQPKTDESPATYGLRAKKAA